MSRSREATHYRTPGAAAEYAPDLVALIRGLGASHEWFAPLLTELRTTHDGELAVVGQLDRAVAALAEAQRLAAEPVDRWSAESDALRFLPASATLLPDRLRALAEEVQGVTTEIRARNAERPDAFGERSYPAEKHWPDIEAVGSKAHLIRAVFAAHPDAPRSPAMWAAAFIALGLEKPCEDGNEWRERRAAWTKELTRVRRSFTQRRAGK